MTTLTRRDPGGEREFSIPLDGPPPGGPFKTGRAALVVKLAPPGERPVGVELRLFPTTFEFQAWLPRLVEIFSLPHDVFALGAAAAEGRPVLHFEAGAEVLSRVPEGLADLAAMNAFLATGPALFDLGEYTLAAIDFESGVAAL